MSTYRGPLKAAILDWAGTVVDYGSCAPAGVFIEVFSRHGIHVSSEQARKPMGMHKRAHIETILQMPEIAAQWGKKHGHAFASKDVDAIYKDFIPLQLECLPRFSNLIPGTLEAVAQFQKRGMKVGTTTGYDRQMIDIVSREAKRQGFVPDSIVCASDVKVGRPYPWMAYQSAMNLEIFPNQAFIKIGDTVADIHEGLNAGMWSVGVAKTGNELGLNEEETKALSPKDLKDKLAAAYDRLLKAGAHYVVDSVFDALPLVDKINARLEKGEQP